MRQSLPTRSPRSSLPTRSALLAATLRPIALSLALLGGLAGVAGPAQAAAPMQQAQAPGWYRTTLGAFEVTALNDGTVALPVDQLLHAKEGRVAEGLKKHYLAAPLDTSVNAWLINTGTRLVLVDAGAGSLFGPTLGKLVTQIRAAGYEPAQVDDILITHMHPDHVGGLAAQGQRVFANAVVHVDQADAAFWLSKANLDAAPAANKGFFQGAQASLQPYVDAGKLQTFSQDAEMVPGIRAVATHGHTPGHAIYAVESQGQRLVLIGDLIHVAAVQLESPEVTIGFDADEGQARAARAKVFAELARDGSLVAAAHFPFPAMGRLRVAGDGFAWEPLNYRSLVR